MTTIPCLHCGHLNEIKDLLLKQTGLLCASCKMMVAHPNSTLYRAELKKRKKNE